MVHQMIRALGFGAVFGAVALAEQSPEKNPVKVLSDEIESMKRFVEPFQGVLHEIGKGFKESAKASTATDAGAAAALKLESQAVTSVRQAAEPEPAAAAPAEVPAAKKEEAAPPAAAAPAAPAVTAAPAAAAEPAAAQAAPAAEQPAAAKAHGTIDEKERKKLWTLLSFPSTVEMGLVAKFASASYFGPKLTEWCANATSDAACKFENGVRQYRQLIRRAAPALMDAVTFSTIAQGILDGEPMPAVGKGQKQAPAKAPAPAATSAAAALQRAAPSDDAALWDDLTASEPFRRKVDSMCSSLKLAHPGCKEVAEEIAYCDALAKAALTQLSFDELSAKLVDAFLKSPAPLQRPTPHN